MTALRFYVDAERVGPLFKRRTLRYGASVRKVARETAKEAGEIIVKLGQGDISRAGDFGTRWTQGLHAEVSEGGGHIRIQITHDIPYWTVFEFGKVIHGKPLLWIPLSHATEAQGVWARNYPAPLFYTKRKSDGLQLLGSTEDRQMKYFGKEQVTIPQKFHLREITRSIAQRLPDIYRENFEQERGIG